MCDSRQPLNGADSEIRSHYPKFYGTTTRQLAWSDGDLSGSHIQPLCAICGQDIYRKGTGRGSRWIHGLDPYYVGKVAD